MCVVSNGVLRSFADQRIDLPRTGVCAIAASASLSPGLRPSARILDVVSRTMAHFRLLESENRQVIRFSLFFPVGVTFLVCSAFLAPTR